MKNLRVTVNGKAYDVQVEELGSPAPTAAPSVIQAPAPAAVQAPAPQPEEQKPAPAAPVQSAGSEKVLAPMPGTILDLKVNGGDSVKKGQVLLILEAMKMENEITSPRDGEIANVIVKKGDNVNTGAPLVSLV